MTAAHQAPMMAAARPIETKRAISPQRTGLRHDGRCMYRRLGDLPPAAGPTWVLSPGRWSVPSAVQSGPLRDSDAGRPEGGFRGSRVLPAGCCCDA